MKKVKQKQKTDPRFMRLGMAGIVHTLCIDVAFVFSNPIRQEHRGE